MPKTKPSPQQTSFIKNEIPKMPEGYYSSGPNPNLRRFVVNHSTPYHPHDDDYEVSSFNKPIAGTKSTAIYNFHTYWSKKPHDAIIKFIEHFTDEEDLVLDPMCGSGSTTLASLITGRKAVAIDLSPSATFITKNFCTPVSIYELDQAFEELLSEISDEMDWLYETICSKCQGNALTTHVIYSQTYICPRCLNKVAMFDCEIGYEESGGKRKKKVRLCPHCLTNGHHEVIDYKLGRQGLEPRAFGFDCQCGCKPRRGERRLKDIDNDQHDIITNYDFAKLYEIKNKDIPYFYPKQRMLNAQGESGQWGLLWRPYHEGIDNVNDFFSYRNLWALAAIRENIYNLEIKPEIRDFLLSGLTAILYKSSLMMGYRDDGIGRVMTGTYWIPQLIKDINVWKYYKEWYGDAKRHLEAKLDLLPSGKELPFIISTQSATNLEDIIDNSVDYIFTDPPYSWKVQYGESNFLWEAWLKLDTSWIEDEIIVNEFRGNDETKWARGMKQVLEECIRVLKPNRWLSLCYHDTAEGTWELVQDIAAEVGFVSESGGETTYIDANQKSIKQITSSKIVKRDLVINFRKPRPGELSRQLTLFGDEDEITFSQKAKSITIQALEAHPGSTIDRLFDELVSRMVRKREFERHNFHEILSSVAEDVDGRWYLLETADQMDEAESRKETEAAAHLETMMHQYLQDNPGEIGVHYSDLFEQFLPIKDKPRRLMQEWLTEFFFKTEDGTWRPPANEDEREQKEALRTSGTLRRIKRFSNALIEGVPPYEKDIPANIPTAADWIRQCRRAGLYEQGRALYEKGGFNFDSLGEEAQMEVEEDYQICVRRS